MNSNFQNRLLQYELRPSEKVWGNIVSDLDEKGMLSQKLLSFEEAPPAAAWKKINDKLDKGQSPGKVIPFFTRYRKPLKYSGALAAFFMIAFVTSLFIGKTTRSEERPSMITESKMNGTVPSNNTTANNVSSQSLVDDQARPARKENIKRSVSIFQRFITTESTGIISGIKKLMPEFADKKNNFTYNPLQDNYIVYSDDEGKAIKMSKKLYDVFACSIADKNCHDHLEQLQQRTAAGTLASDFTGMLDILNNLKENQ